MKEDLEKENLTGRYLKVLCPEQRQDLKYLKNTDSNKIAAGLDKTVTYKTKEYPHEWMDIIYRCNNGEFILMPVGFNPNNINNEIQYEIC